MEQFLVLRFLRKPRAQVTILLLAALILGGYVASGVIGEAGAETSISGARVMLASPADQASAAYGPEISKLRAKGFTVTSDVQEALSLTSQSGTAAFLATRDTFAEVPPSTWSTLYSSGALIGGLDVSLQELQPLVEPDRPVGSARLHYTPGRPIFSILFSKGCRQGAMSDWLSYDVSGIVEQRLAELANTPRSSSDNCLPQREVK